MLVDDSNYTNSDRELEGFLGGRGGWKQVAINFSHLILLKRNIVCKIRKKKKMLALYSLQCSTMLALLASS